MLGKMVLANYKGLIFTNEDSAVYMNQLAGKSDEFYFRRLTKGPYFEDLEGRVGFLSNLVVRLINRNLNLPWLVQAVSDFLVDQSIDDANKLLFGIGLYSDTLSMGFTIEKADDFFTALNLQSADGQVITPDLCKSYIQEVITRKKLAEVESLRKRLGLQEE